MAVVDLFREGKIGQYEHDVYVLFETHDLGRDFIKKMMESIAMETPLKPDPLIVMQADGRRSAWREIKHIIDTINRMMEEGK